MLSEEISIPFLKSFKAEMKAVHPYRYASPKDIFKIYPKRARVRCHMQKWIEKPKTTGRKRTNRCGRVLQNFMTHFSAAGITRIYDSRGYFRKIAWFFFVVASFVLMSYMTYMVIKEYLEYKKSVQTTNVILSSLEFPAVTICSPITLPKSRAQDAGIERLVKLEKFIQRVEKYKNDTYDRRDCKKNPTCIWIWFTSQCKCLSNPCESEYCEMGTYGSPVCSCSSLLCNHYKNSCFHLENSSQTNDDEVCFCRNQMVDGESDEEYEVTPRKNEKLILDHIRDKEVRDLMSFIRQSEIDDLSDISWVFQPNIYNLGNYGTSFDNLVIGCSFQKTACNESNFTTVYTTTHGKCYTFNYAGEYAKTPERPLESKKYGWNSGLQLYLKIRDDEIIDMLTKDQGVIVVVHDPRELPFVSEYGLAIRVGDSASLRVERTQINRLGEPWGKCLTSGEHLPFNYSDKPYSQLGCQRTCTQFYINQKCKCLRRSLIPASVLRPKDPDEYNTCNSFANLAQNRSPVYEIRVFAEECAEQVTESIENETIPCNCYQACSETVFSTSLTAGHINKNFFRLVKAAKTLRLRDGRLVASDSSSQNNILGLKVYYGTLSLQNQTESPGYSWEMLISNIGGNLGFFTGITLMTFVELVELFWDLVLFILRHH